MRCDGLTNNVMVIIINKVSFDSRHCLKYELSPEMQHVACVSGDDFFGMLVFLVVDYLEVHPTFRVIG